jgi:predicted PurR-regulated permease PerM
MQPDNPLARENLSRELMDVLIRLGLVAFLVVMSAQIFAPFMGMMLWALILAVTLYPLHQGMAKRLGGKQGRAATLLVLIGLLLVGGPSVILGDSLAGQLHQLYTAIQNDELAINPPDPSVAEWPVVGKEVHAVWSSAAENLPQLLKERGPQLRELSETVLAMATSTVSGFFSFLVSLIIAGIMMAYGESGSAAMLQIINRFSGMDKGAQLHKLSTATIRSVAMGVIGVAFIQALLLGVGFVWADIPGAGILAVAVLLLGIVQIPAAVVSLPAIAYLWWSGDASTTSNIIFTIYLLIAGLADNVLKPLLLGRGVETPMPIILLGALGGMVSAGLIGLFIGAVLLALGYEIFMAWVTDGQATAESEQAAPVNE